jgi:hypothetical protein
MASDLNKRYHGDNCTVLPAVTCGVLGRNRPSAVASMGCFNILDN